MGFWNRLPRKIGRSAAKRDESTKEAALRAEMAELIWLHLELSRCGADSAHERSVPPDVRESALALNCDRREDVVKRLSEILDLLKISGTGVGVPDFDDF